MKLFIALAIVSLLFAGQAWAIEPAWNIPVERSTSKSVIVWDYSTGKYVTLENKPELNDPQSRNLPLINPCPWRHMIVPKIDMCDWLDEGWVFVKTYSVDETIIRKRICQEGK